MQTLIFNADDFGLTTGINKAVAQAHTQGVLSSATVMANGLAWQEAVALAIATPSLGVGIHLTLTALKPVLPARDVPDLVAGSGYFRRNFLRLLWTDKRQIKAEWQAQISRLMEAGLKPSHLDSHHHVHLMPALTGLTCELAREFGIPALRALSPASTRLMGIRGPRSWLAAKSWRLAEDSELGVPDTVTALEIVAPSSGALTEFLGRLGPGVHEIFCHPGLETDPDLAGVSSLKEQRARELAILKAPWLAQALVGARVSNYRLLKGGDLV